MDPKFQSSFIPRGAAITSTSVSSSSPLRRPQERGLFSLIAGGIFTLSILFALGVFGYKMFLSYRIESMGRQLEEARAALEPETVTELIRLSDRIASTEKLIKNHRIISPVFDFLEASTPSSVRYTEFNFNVTPRGLELNLNGEAQGYAALASAATVFDRSDSNFRNAAFSDLRLDTKGNVVFTLKLEVDPALLSYERFLSSSNSPQPVQNVTPASTSTPADNLPPI